MALKLDEAGRRVDAQLRAVNRKLTTAAREFGVQSPQYGYLESLVTSIYTADNQTRKNAQGILQVSRTAANVRLSAMAEEQKIIRKITSQYDLKTHKQRLLHDWAEREAQKPYNRKRDVTADDILAGFSAGRKRTIVRQEASFYRALQEGIDRALNKIYHGIKRQTRETRQAVEQMRKTSQGRWTDRDTLVKNLKKLLKSLGEEGKQMGVDFYNTAGIRLDDV